MKSVPTHWVNLRLRSLATIQGGGTPGPEPENWDGDVPFVTPPDLRPVHGSVCVETSRTLTPVGARSGSRMAPSGALIVSKRAPIGYVARLAMSAAYNQGCLVVVPDPRRAKSEFLTWALSVRAEEMNVLGRGTTFMEIAAGDLGDLVLSLPSLDEQCAITDYLDRETAQIDALIGKQKRLIETLRERRAAVITRAITGAGQQNVWETGSAWYPLLPVGWRFGRVKSASLRITDGAHISPDTEGGLHDFVSTRDVKRGAIDFAGALKTSPETYDYMVRTGCRPCVGDVLFSKDGTVGETAVVRDQHPFVVASSLVIITPDPARLDADFLSCVFGSKPARENATAFMRGAGLPRISVGNLARIELPLPPLDEQRRIADYLNEQTAKIDALIAKAERFIEVSKERRSALVTAAVTGQIDVRNSAPSAEKTGVA